MNNSRKHLPLILACGVKDLLDIFFYWTHEKFKSDTSSLKLNVWFEWCSSDMMGKTGFISV